MTKLTTNTALHHRIAPSSIPDVQPKVEESSPIQVSRRGQQLTVQTYDFRDLDLSNLNWLVYPDPPRPNAGLEPAVWVILVWLGLIFDSRPPCPRIRFLEPPTEFPCPDGFRHDQQLLEFVEKHNHGLILLGNECDLAWLIAQIALGYPDKKISVISNNRKENFQLASRLRSLGISVTTPNNRFCPPDVQNLVVGTFTDMAHNEIEFSHFDIVIVLDSVEALTYYGEIALLEIDARFRLFGFQRAGSRLSPRQRTLIQATFGFDRIDIRKHGFQPIEMRTVFTPTKARMPTTDIDNMLLNRKGIWQHPVRNRRIATLACALAEGDFPKLQQRYRDVAGVIDMQRRPAKPLRTAILVESLEHGLALAKQMPHWNVKTGPHVILDDLSRSHRRILQRWCVGNQLIVTSSALHSLDFTELDVLIWAGAGSHLPPLPANRLICPGDQPHRLLLVDFNDRHHPQLRRWSRQRRKAYEHAGWYECGVKPVLARIKRFLAEQWSAR